MPRPDAAGGTIPDAMGPLTGYRSFTASFEYGWRDDGKPPTYRPKLGCRHPDAGPHLHGVYDCWLTVDKHAICWVTGSGGKASHETPPPDPACSCGIYAWKLCSDVGLMAFRTPGALDGPGILNLPVAAEVRLWGRVMEHEYGYRAQHARITGLWLPRMPYPWLRVMVDLLHSAYPGLPLGVHPQEVGFVQLGPGD
jgi:hypothetical protein